MDGRLFSSIDLDAMRLPGVTKGQHELLRVIDLYSNHAGHWTGPRSQLAHALRCSPDTVTRRKDALVERGLLSVVPAGRCLTYTLIRTAVENVQQSNPAGPRADNLPRKRTPWFKRPDANQLELPFEPATRAEVVQRLGANLLQTLSLVITLVVGPAAKRKEPATSAPNQPQIDVKPATEQREKGLIEEHLERVRAARPAKPPAEQPHTIDPTPITTPTSITSNIQRPTEPTSIGSGTSKTFCLWRNAGLNDFKNPVLVQEIFNRLVKAKLCTVDERQHVFRFVAHCVRTVDRSKYSLAGVITNNLRGDGQGSKMLPWRARGDESDEAVAKQMIRSLDVDPALQKRTGDLYEADNEQANALHRQKEALAKRIRERGTA